MLTETQASHVDVQVSTRTVPWMTLGKLTDDVMSAAEAANAGGLNFTVSKCELAYAVGTWEQPKSINRINDRVAIVRDDTNQWLGIMSKDYPVLQYHEAFDFMDTISPHYVAAGALKGGRQGFIVVKPDVPLLVLDGDDPHDFYAVLRTSHDGSRAVEVMIMPLRLRCMNQLTLSAFGKDAPLRWSVKHTSSMTKKLSEAQHVLSNMKQYAARYSQLAMQLAEYKVSDAVAEQILKNVLPDRPKRPEVITRIIDTWHNSPTIGGHLDYTGWGLLNAVSDDFEHGRSGGSPESRFIGALEGQTYRAVNRVADTLQRMALVAS